MFRIRLYPHSYWAWIRDPDPYSESGSGSWIQMSKNRLKKPKFTVTDFKDKNSKMLWLSWNFNHSFLSLFEELITLGNFILSRTVTKLSHKMKIFCWLCYYITLCHYKLTKQGGKVIFFQKKNRKKIYFYTFFKIWIRDPESGSILRFQAGSGLNECGSKTLPLYTVYLPHQLLHMLFLTPFRNFWATVFLNWTVENMAE